MDKEGTYDDLTDAQKARFQAVMEKLEKLDVLELLLNRLAWRLPKPRTEEGNPGIARTSPAPSPPRMLLPTSMNPTMPMTAVVNSGRDYQA